MAKKKAAVRKNLVLSPSLFTPEEEKLRAVVGVGRQVCSVCAHEEAIPRIRVSWQGCMTWVSYAESPLIENPVSAVVVRDKIPRFAQTGMNYQEYLVSGLNLGGTRDLLGASPRRWFHPVPSTMSSTAGVLFSTACGPAKKRLVHDKAMTKPLPTNDQQRMYGPGTVQEACEKDSTSYIKSLVYSDSSVFDAAFSRMLCASSVSRACTGDITYGGNQEELFLNAIRMAASHWAMFYSLFNYLVNFMSRHTKLLYTAETGFIRNIGPDNSLTLWKVEREKPTRLQVAVEGILDAIATFVRAVLENTPCPLRPWLTVHIYHEEVERIGTALQLLVVTAEQSQVLALIGRKLSTNATRVTWESVFAKIFDLHLFYKAARTATRISCGILKENRLIASVLRQSRATRANFTGYAMSALTYHALINDGSLPPGLGYCPIDMELFAGYLAQKSGNMDSVCYFMHPYTCAMAYVSQQNLLIEMGHEVKAGTPETFLSFFLNALGPDHMLTMQIMFAQGEADTSMRLVRNTPNVESDRSWDNSTLAVQPSLYAINIMEFVRASKNVFVDADFTTLFLRKLMDGCIAKHVLYCTTINKKDWFPRVRYMSPVNDPPNHIKRTFMANRISLLWRAHSARRKMLRYVKMCRALQVLERFYRMKVLFPIRIARRVARRVRGAAKMVIGRFVSSARLRIVIGRRIAIRVERLAESRAREESLLLAKRLGENRATVSRLARVFVMMRIVARVAKEHVLFLAATRIQALVRGFFLRRAAKSLAVLIRFQRVCSAYAKKSMWLRSSKEVNITATTTAVMAPMRPTTVSPATILRRPQRLSMEARYAHTVHKVANVLAHLFSVGNLSKDKFLVSKCAPDGTVLFGTLLGFPSINMYACVVGCRKQLLVDAASCIKGLVFCSEWGIGNRMWRDEYRCKCADYCMEQHFLAQRYGFATSI